MRKKHQAVWDKVALLKLLEGSAPAASAPKNLWLQKLTFLYEVEALRAGLSPMHFRFFRYNLGPYSPVLAEDVKSLEARGFLSPTTRRPTKRGQYLIDYVKDAVEQSPEASLALDLMSRVASRYAHRTGPRLTDIVYGLVVPVLQLDGEELKVRDIPKFYDIIDPVCTPGLKDVQPLDARLIADVEEELSIPPEDLRPSSPKYKRAVKAALSRLAEATSPTA